MSMLIAIPSCGRAQKQITLRHIRKHKLEDRTVLVVPFNEAERYRLYLGEKVKIVQCPHNGISKTREWILCKLTEEMGYDKVLMVDDDMDFCVRPEISNAKLLTIEDTKTFMGMLETLEDWLDHGFAHVGLSARQGNNREFYDEHGVYGLHPYRDATRMMNCYAYNVKTLKLIGNIEFGRTEVMEDFDLTLQLLRRGFPNRVSFHYCWNQRGSDKEGGCSKYRTPAVQQQAAETLADLHPGFVKVVIKKSKDSSPAWKNMKERYDVSVQWRKAFDSFSGKATAEEGDE